MSADEIPVDEALRSLEYMGDQLRRARQDRDQYRAWFEKLLDAVRTYAGDNVGLRAALDQVQAEHERVVNARTRKRQQTAAEKKAEAIRRYQANDLVKNIAADLQRSQRWVYEVIPKEMKRRR